jgi:hypothetical protein
MQAGYVAAGVAVVKFGIDSVKAFEEAQNVMAQTENVLRSTGGQANVTERQVLELASTWQDLTGIQDDAIQSSENLLLTFRDVTNEVGKGNDIFSQAEVSILDMATALNRGAIPSAEELQKITIQLGKALNDPIVGMTALRRVGVSFNQSQVATIKRLQESGDLMGAQKVILKELNAEFGGAAKAAGDTFAGQVAKLRAEINNLQESIGGLIVGELVPLVAVLNDIANARLPAATDALHLFGTVADVVSRATGLLPPQVKELTDALGDNSKEIEFSKSRIEDWAQSIRLGGLSFEQLRAQLKRTGAPMENVDQIMGDVHRTVDRMTSDFNHAGDVIHHFANLAGKDLQGFKHDTVGSVREMFGSIDGFEKKWALTGKEVAKTQSDMVKKSKQVAKDYKELDRTAVPEGFQRWLLEQGPDAVHVFAQKSAQGQKQMLADWRATKSNLQSITDSIKHILGVGGEEAGVAFSQGIAHGIASGKTGVTTASANVAEAAMAAAKSKLGISSPSKEMHKIGVATMQGFIEGMSSMSSKVPVLSLVGGTGPGRAAGSAGQSSPGMRGGRGGKVILDRRHYVEQADYESTFRGF